MSRHKLVPALRSDRPVFHIYISFAAHYRPLAWSQSCQARGINVPVLMYGVTKTCYFGYKTCYVGRKMKDDWQKNDWQKHGPERGTVFRSGPGCRTPLWTRKTRNKPANIDDSELLPETLPATTRNTRNISALGLKAPRIDTN